MTTKSESFWLACLMGAIVLAMLLTALLVIPWRSNFMVFQLDAKQKPAIPAIDFNAPQKPAM